VKTLRRGVDYEVAEWLPQEQQEQMVQMINESYVRSRSELLSAAQVAEIVGESPCTVQRWMRERKMPGAAQLPGGQWRIRQDCFQSWLVEKEVA
jgi:excisionase family DNA binding protein